MNCNDAFGRPLIVRDFAIGHVARGVASQYANFLFHLRSSLFRDFLVIILVAQFTAVLRDGTLVSCHISLTFLLYFNKLSMPDISNFRFKRLIFLDDSL
jgi:hypothetical protein